MRTEGRGRIVDEWKQRPERGDNSANWNRVNLPDRQNGLAALTFCEAPIDPSDTVR